MLHDHEILHDRIETTPVLDPLSLAITALVEASEADARAAFTDSVQAFARRPDELNALKMEAAALALREHAARSSTERAV